MSVVGRGRRGKRWFLCTAELVFTGVDIMRCATGSEVKGPWLGEAAGEPRGKTVGQVGVTPYRQFSPRPVIGEQALCDVMISRVRPD